MSPHTKGPWSVWGVGEVVSKEFGGTLCDCYGPDDVAEANAQLISAAPELLEALEHMANQHKCGCGHPVCNRCEDDQNNERVLAKAKGTV